MNTLKSKIITLRYAKILFYSIFLIGTVIFLFITASNSENIVRNGSISVFLMIFGFGMAEICSYYIKLFLEEYKALRKKYKLRKDKIIEFEKIA